MGTGSVFGQGGGRMGGRKRGRGGAAISKLMDASDFGMGGDMMPMSMGGAGGMGGSGGGKGLGDKVIDQIAKIDKTSSKLACDCDHGVMIEALKKYMFGQ